MHERPLGAPEKSDLIAFAEAGRDGLRAVGLPMGSPIETVTSISAVVNGLRDVDHDHMVGASVGFGALWGDQVCKAARWEWVMLTPGPEDEELFAIVSPTRSHFISALYLFLPYATYAQDEDTSILLFNMLVAGEPAGGTPGAYTELS